MAGKSKVTRGVRAGMAALCILITSPILAQDIQQEESGVWTTTEQKASIVMPKSNHIVIRSAASVSGSIVIETGYIKEAQLAFTKKAKTGSRSTAIDYLDVLSVSMDAFGGRGRLEFRAPNPAPWSGGNDAGTVVAKLILPKGTFVEIEAAYFDVKARGPLSGLMVTSSFGEIDVSQIDSIVDVATSNQKVVLDDISGDISASTSNAPLTASRICPGRVAARFKNENGDIRLDSVVGSINVRNGFGKIAVNRLFARGEGSSIRGSSGPVSVELLEITEGQLVITNRLEDIELQVPPDLSAFLSLAVEEDGNIEATGFTFRTDLVQKDRLNLLTGDGKANISCAIKGKGNIFVRGGAAE
jgi:hypothetical protein